MRNGERRASWKPAIGDQVECGSCGLRFRVVSLEMGASAFGRSDIVALGTSARGCDNPFYRDQCWAYHMRPATAHCGEGQADPNPDRSESPDDSKWLDSLDEAIASVTSEEYGRLKGQHPYDVKERLEEAFKSIDRLRKPEQQPRYDDWDALLYFSWYQARQVHLVCAILEQHPPPPSGKPLRVVDVGCGAWAVPIALAILKARGHPALIDREVSVHGIERKHAMTRMGEELWIEFGCAAEARGLHIDFEMIDEDSIFSSADEYLKYLRPPARDASTECWLLAIHALYDESQGEIRRFLAEYRSRRASRLRYQLLTTDDSKQQILASVVGGPFRSHVTPIWKSGLTETTECRRKIRRGLEDNPLTDKYMYYLRKRVSWNQPNPIQQDAIWVRKADP